MKFNPFDFAALSFHYYQKIKKKNLIPKKIFKKKKNTIIFIENIIF